jgi:hypothetical protein
MANQEESYMTGAKYAMLMVTAASIGLAGIGSNMASAEPKSAGSGAAEQAPAPLKNVIGEIADGEAVFVDGKSFEIAKGKAKGKDDTSALVQKLRAGPLENGTIIFRSGDKLYIAAAAPASYTQPPTSYMQGYQPMPPAAAYMQPPTTYMQPQTGQRYQPMPPAEAYMQPPTTYMQPQTGQRYQPMPPAEAYMQPPTTYMQPQTGQRYQPMPPAAAYMQPQTSYGYQPMPPAEAYMKPQPGKGNETAASSSIRKAFEDNWSW